jgi:dTDP-4-amino-4,6-dideoxygalactose transaminase
MLRRPIVPYDCVHNGHLYYVLLNDLITRTRIIDALRNDQIFAVFHYVPLHSSPAGRRYGRTVGELPVTIMAGDCLLRLPIWVGMAEEDVDRIVAIMTRTLRIPIS